MSQIEKRYDFVLLFDVKDGNPNGDPDAGNLPRIDPETGHGLVTDVCLKRKVRNYVLLSRSGAKGYDVFIKEKAILNKVAEEAYRACEIDLESDKDADGNKRAKKGRGQGSEVTKVRDAMCRAFFDIRAFGAVLSVGPNAGQVRGPVQLTFARSIDPVVPLEHSITRMAVTTEEDAAKQGGDNRTMGRKNTIPYGLYASFGFVTPALAKQTAFSTADLEVLWESFGRMFELDRSAARGLMSLRRAIVFEHDSALGNAPAHRLFDLVKVSRRDTSRPARCFDDYDVSVGTPPPGVKVVEPVQA